MCPALLSFIESLVDRRIITDECALEDFFVDDRRKRLAVFVDTIEGDRDVFVEERPNRVDTPRRFVTVHDGRISQNRAEGLELAFPRSGELVEQAVGLRFLQVQLLKKAEYLAGFIHRQSEAMDLIAQGEHDLDSKFTSSQDAFDTTELISIAVNFISDQNGLAVFESPNDTGVRESAVAGCDVFWIDGFEPLCLFDFLSRGDTASTSFFLRVLSLA